MHIEYKTVLVVTYNCIYACKYARAHTVMQLGFMHTNFSGSMLFQIQTYPSKTNNFEHVNAAFQYPVRLYMLLMLDWADIRPGSVRYCGSIPMQIQFVVLVGQYPSTFFLFLFHFDTYQDSASCYGPIPIHFNLLFLWVNTHLNSGAVYARSSNWSANP